MTVVPPAVQSVRSRPMVLATTVFVIAGLVTWYSLVPYTVGVFHDDGVYALLAQSIAAGHGFHYSHLVGNPAATHYPPLYPLMLAVVWHMVPAFPSNVMPLLALNAVCVAVAALGWWKVAATRLGWRDDAAALGALACTLTAPVLALAGALLSESLFLALLWPALLMSERAGDSADRRSVLMAAVAIGILMLARTHGVALFIALVGVLAVRKRWIDAGIAFVVTFAIQLPWLLWTHSASPHVPAPLEGAYGSYLGWFAKGLRSGGVAFLVSTARLNVHEMWLLLGDQFFVARRLHLVAPIAALVLASMVWGCWALRRRAPVTITFLLVYVGIVSIWPYTPWRFMWTVWPLLLMLAVEGVRATGRVRPVALSLASIPVLAFAGTAVFQLILHDWRNPSIAAAVQIAPVVDWVRGNTQPGDVVLTEGEQVVALYAGRQAAPPIDFTAREYLAPPDDAEGTRRLREMLGAVRAKYVILLAPPMIRAADSLAAVGVMLTRIATLEHAAVFEVTR